ncbi:hypothetical protein A5N82_12995 [Christensenella minuta]|uniref:Phage head-tail adaptor n=2 Tax=Christensenella TaxID=990721 RepID=A0A136Q8D6_9FIRM|nr:MULTISPECIES: hypothetical protein [Christensenella]AYH41316.1 hypothetical protein B1H56_12780 [Christensenella minuta]AYH41350.1 hypothetical protein B1H56_12965 [Christensenella minuta]KXK66941.1 hypothetical protein HMPREF3293_00197 [Christensenella minuta]MBC5647555.1 hypothetical protein [Christensenella tenuis]OAQ39370.1 hypothetical protein A5N82_12995 [Christensenella minuta]
MISRRMKAVKIVERDISDSVFGKDSRPREVKTVQMAICTLTGAEVQYLNINAQGSSHVGLTLDRTLKHGQEVHDGDDVYRITYPNNDARLSQIFLERVIADG